jgi:molybdenum cofactor cytidylyltransferase
MSFPSLSVLIPAAGASERLGHAKQLVIHKGTTLIQNAVNTAFSLDPREIIVVTGAKAEAVKNAVPQPPVNWIHNPNWSNGMGGSIALGATAISPESTGLMILLCDQWKIQVSDLQLLAKTWQSDPERIVCASAEGVNMPPVIFPAGYFNQLTTLEGSQGARSLLLNHPESLTAVPIKNAAIDLDTQSQLGKLKKTRP